MGVASEDGGVLAGDPIPAAAGAAGTTVIFENTDSTAIVGDSNLWDTLVVDLADEAQAIQDAAQAEYDAQMEAQQAAIDEAHAAAVAAAAEEQARLIAEALANQEIVYEENSASVEDLEVDNSRNHNSDVVNPVDVEAIEDVEDDTEEEQTTTIEEAASD